jgi:hypothetical protein
VTGISEPRDSRENRSKFGMSTSLENDKKPSWKNVCKEKKGGIWQV